MGATQSHSHSVSHTRSSSKKRPQRALKDQYPSPNTSGSTLSSNHLHPSFSPSPPSSHTATSHSTLQKTFSRRRSSNQTVESVSSHGSASTANSSLKPLSSHSEEEDEEFRWFHGRRYHNTSSLYMLPNDTEEIDRLHLQHYIFKMALGKNIHVPIPKDGRVIDLGCGPATWCMEMATDMRTTNFVGVDISPIFPTAIHPRNCNFYKEDILTGLSQPDNVFDVAYQRNVAPGFTFENWQRSIQEAYRVLKPGGWFESVESDVTIQDAGPHTLQVFAHLRLSMSTRNVDPSVVRSLDRLMIAAGFVDVHVKEYCIPMGAWTGDPVGKLWQQNMLAIAATARPHLAKAGRITEGQVAAMCEAMYQETQSYRSHQTVYVTYGRKPL